MGAPFKRRRQFSIEAHACPPFLSNSLGEPPPPAALRKTRLGFPVDFFEKAWYDDAMILNKILTPFRENRKEPPPMANVLKE